MIIAGLIISFIVGLLIGIVYGGTKASEQIREESNIKEKQNENIKEFN